MVNAPNRIVIELSALVKNLNQVKAWVGEKTKIMGIVKADAYGHGLLPISQTLEKNEIHCLGVAHLFEALELRENGIKAPIVILNGVQTAEEAREAARNNLTPVLYDLASAEILARESMRLGKKTAVHLKVDTGMGRLGILYDEIGPVIHQISALKGLDLKALTSHLSSADESEDSFTATQIRRFKDVIQTVRNQGFHLPLNSLANSAGILGHKDACFEMVRIGIALYGGHPCPGYSSPIPLTPVMHFKGRILQIRDLPDRTPVSYGRTFHTRGPSRIAVLSAGYADGLPRALSNTGQVLIRGQKAPIIGTVCMNLTITDITGIKDAKKGDEAVFLGSQGDRTITGDEVAANANTISYEVFCSLGLGKKKEYEI